MHLLIFEIALRATQKLFKELEGAVALIRKVHLTYSISFIRPGVGGLTFDTKCIYQIAFRVDVAHELAQGYLLIVVDGSCFSLFDNDRVLLFDIS